MSSFPFRTFLAALLVSSCLVPVAQAATITWDGGAGTDSWGDAANWSGNAVPTDADWAILDEIGVTIGIAGATTAGIHVGQTTNGGLSIQDGGQFVTNGIDWKSIGNVAGSTGTVVVTGAGSNWANTGDLNIGQSGTGTLQILNGGLVSTTKLYIGGQATGDGTVIVNGSGSEFLASEGFYIGNSGTGTLNVEAGGSVSSAAGYNIQIGFAADSDGSTTVTGADSEIVSGRAVVIGNAGTGTLTISDGGSVTSAAGYDVSVGIVATGDGTVMVTGEESELNSGSYITIGHLGTGSLTVSAGGVVSSATGYAVTIGSASTGDGTATVTGGGSTLEIGGETWVGSLGVGLLTISNGGAVNTSSGYNSYIGAFVGGSGTVNVTGAESQFEAGSHIVVGSEGTGTLTVSNEGSVVSATGYNIIVGHINTGNGSIAITGSNSTLQSGKNISIGNAGTGTLTVSASGAVSATGNVTIANQSTSTGTLNIGAAAGDAAAAVGTVSAGTGLAFGAGDGTLVFNHTSNDYDFDLDISNNAAGTATIKAVAGTTNLTGDLSDYTGDFQITGGTLNLASSLGTTTLEGSITGAGALSFLSGTTNLTGDSSAFTGTVSAGGIVSVNGSLGGTVNVLSGGTLMGIGTVNDANIQSGGAVAPGNSIGTLNVAGDVAFAAGSTYEVEVDATTSDKIEATGTATLNGGDVVLTPYNGASVTAGTSYTILSAAGGLLGTGFDSVSLASNSLFLGAALRSDANNVYANITQTRSFASVAATDNQAAAANAAETLGGGNAVYDAIALQSDVSVVRTAFTTLAGEIHANARAAVWEDQAEQSRMLTGRLAKNEKTNIWAQGIGAWGHRKGDGNAEGFKRESKGVMLGADGPVTKNIKLGGAMGYSHGDLRQDTAAKGQKDSYSLHVYGGYGLGKLNLRAGAGYGWHEINTQRTVTIGSTYTGNPKASYHAQTAQGFAEAAYGGIGDKDATLEPFANLTYGYTRTSGFTEKGGAAALTAGSQGQSLGLSTLGARVRTSLPFIIRSPSLKGGCKDCNEQANFEGTLGWQHLIGGRNPSRDMAFASTPAAAFTTSGAPMARDALAVGVSATYDFANDMSLGVAYQGRLAPDDSSHAVTGRVGVRF
jgi:outer membrane autotransporter protein